MQIVCFRELTLKSFPCQPRTKEFFVGTISDLVQIRWTSRPRIRSPLNGPVTLRITVANLLDGDSIRRGSNLWLVKTNLLSDT